MLPYDQRVAATWAQLQAYAQLRGHPRLQHTTYTDSLRTSKDPHQLPDLMGVADARPGRPAGATCGPEPTARARATSRSAWRLEPPPLILAKLIRTGLLFAAAIVVGLLVATPARCA